MGTTGAGEDMGACGSHVPGEAAARDGDTTLSAEIQRVLARVDTHAARSTRSEATHSEAKRFEAKRSEASHAGQSSPEAASAAPVPAAGPGTAPLDAVLTCFGLTPFERDLVLLTAAQELEPTT